MGDPSGYESELTEAVALARRVYENGVDGVAVLDHDLQYRYWGPVLEELSGIPRRSALRRTLRDVHPTSRDTTLDALLRRTLEGASSVGRTLFFPAPRGVIDGTFEVFWLPLHGAGSRAVLGGVALVRNRLEYKELRQQMHELDLRFRRMADGSPVLLWMAGIDGLCNFFNQTWLDFTGRTLEQEAGYGWAEGVHPEDFERCMSFYMAEFNARRAFEMEYRLLRGDGAYRWILDRGAPRLLNNGEFAGYIGSCVDITDRKAAEEATRRTAARLERTAADLERFAYVAAHDLRAPLRALDHLMTWLEEDLGPAPAENVAERLTLMRRRVGRMDRLLQSLLDYARAGAETQLVSRVDVGAVVAEIFDLVRGLYPGFEFVAEGRLPVFETAGVALEHVLQNLVENAARHHDRERGRIVVRAAEIGAFYEFSVADDGPGIPAAMHDRVFEIFQTLQPRDRRESTGMGLALSKRIIESVGGRLRLESPTREGRGATFWFTWPAAGTGREA